MTDFTRELNDKDYRVLAQIFGIPWPKQPTQEEIDRTADEIERDAKIDVSALTDELMRILEVKE